MRERKTLNKPLLRKLALKLRRLRHEEHYDQGVWARTTRCGTAACIAGHAAALAGWSLRPIPKDEDPTPQDACVMGGREVPVMRVASALTGIRDDHWLFSDAPGDDWPAPFDMRWRYAETSGLERPSRIAADLLDAIADGKVTL